MSAPVHILAVLAITIGSAVAINSIMDHPQTYTETAQKQVVNKQVATSEKKVKVKMVAGSETVAQLNAMGEEVNKEIQKRNEQLSELADKERAFVGNHPEQRVLTSRSRSVVASEKGKVVEQKQAKKTAPQPKGSFIAGRETVEELNLLGEESNRVINSKNKQLKMLRATEVSLLSEQPNYHK